jgi:tRNA(Arg) A34 adenosine deaminase TadA
MMETHPISFKVPLPEWMAEQLYSLPEYFDTAEKRMALILQFARQNAAENTGGPFAAGVFESLTGRLVAIGVNRVVPTSCSSAHAEIVAISLAQCRLGVYDLGGPGQPVHELVVNWRPCAMCFGAVLWSGIRKLTIAGSGPELETLTGFDEGPIHPQWLDEMTKRGIAFQEGVLREDALALFRWFSTSGRSVYNARQQ